MNYSYCKHSFFPGSYQSFHRHVSTWSPSMLLFFLNLCFKSDSFFIFLPLKQRNVRNFATIPPVSLRQLVPWKKERGTITIIVGNLNFSRLNLKKKSIPLIINSTKEEGKRKAIMERRDSKKKFARARWLLRSLSHSDPSTCPPPE